MDSSEEQKYLERLQELVEDEDKIVTVPFLARTLEISIQDSSKLLQKYVENRKKSHADELTVTYVITGTLKNGTGNTVCMVKESEIEEKKDSLQNLTSEVIYSVQKAKQVDFNVVALVDWPTTDPKALPGSIVSKNCTKRTIRIKVLPSPPKPTLKGKSSYFIPKTEKSIEKPTETNAKAKPIGVVADLFNKATTSKTKQPEQKINNSKPNNVSKSKGTLSAFFSKGSSSSANSIKSEDKINDQKMEEEASSTVPSSKESEEMEINDDDFANFMEVDYDEEKEEIKKEKEETKKETEEVKKNENVKSTTKKNKKKHSKRKRDGSEEKNIKKRKRIIQYNESDSDDIFEKEEDIIETSEPEPERVPSPLPQKVLPPKNKRRKTVENTYMDDEGFVVTKTEYVYETASEDENEQPPESQPKKQEEKKKENGITKKSENSITKKSSNSSEGENSPKTVATKGGKKGKKNNNMQNQPTLMNFFKKK